MDKIFKQISDYMKGTEMTRWDVILTAVISALIIIVIAFFWKSICKLAMSLIVLFLKLLNSLRKNIIAFCSNKYRRFKGELTYDEFIVIADKKEKGLEITKKEIMLYDKNAPKYPYRKLLKGINIDIDKSKLDEFLKNAPPLNIQLVEPPKFDNIIFKK